MVWIVSILYECVAREFHGCGSGRRAVAHYEQGNVVRLAGAARKGADRLKDRLLQGLDGNILLAREGLWKTGNLKKIVIGVFGFGYAVTE